MKTTYFGLTNYQNAKRIQNQAYQVVQSSGFPVVLGFEFYPLLTFNQQTGLSANTSLQALSAKGIDVVGIQQPGPMVFYSPGQLVISPLVPIQKFQISEAQFVGLLQEATIAWLQKYKIQATAGSKANLEILTSRGKIASIQLEKADEITRHSLVIHLSNETSISEEMGPSAKIDCVFNYNTHVEINEAFAQWNLYWASVLMKALPDPG